MKAMRPLQVRRTDVLELEDIDQPVVNDDAGAGPGRTQQPSVGATG